MCHLLGVPFELRAPTGLIGADAETKQAPFLRLNPLGQARAATRMKHVYARMRAARVRNSARAAPHFGACAQPTVTLARRRSLC